MVKAEIPSVLGACSRFYHFWFLCLVSLFIPDSCSPRRPSTEQHMPGRAARGRASERWSCEPWLGGNWELQAMAPWELAALGSPRLRRCLPSLQHLRKSTEASSNSLQNAGIPSEKRKRRGKPFTAEHEAPSTALNALSACPEIIGFGPCVTSPAVHSSYSHLLCWVSVAKLTVKGLSLLQHHSW